MKTESEFTAWLQKGFVDLTEDLGYTPTRFIQMVQERGGLAACKALLRPDIPASWGFCKLFKLGKPEYTVEHLVVNSEWSHFFTSDEKIVAKFRLDNAKSICADSKLLGT